MSMLSGAMAGNAMPLVGWRNAGELLEILVVFFYGWVFYMVLLFFCFCRGQWKHEARGWFLVEHGDRTNRFRMDGFEKLRKHQEAVMLLF